MPDHINHNVSIIRRLHGKTLEDVSSRLGMSRSAYYRIENGDPEAITDEFLGKFCRLFFIDRPILEGDKLEVRTIRTL